MFSFSFFTLASWRRSDDGDIYWLLSCFISHILTVVRWWEVLKTFNCLCFHFLSSLSHLDGGWMMEIIICRFLLSYLDGCCSWVMEIFFLALFSHIKLVGWWGNPLVAWMLGSFNCLCFNFLSSLSHLDAGWMIGIIICWFLLSYLDGCCSWVMEIFFCLWLFFLT